MVCLGCCWCKHCFSCLHRCEYFGKYFVDEFFECSYEESDLCPDFATFFKKNINQREEDSSE